ncbi:glycosyltransferase family 4 protein, partial [Escherichia coli]|nr:glycosyltransferase family 4 protein [Escherichia coli]
YFVLCGKEVDTSLKDSLVQKNLQEKVKLLPFRKDVVKVLNSSQLFYFPSYTEGQPNALIEAMVAGLAFVTSSIDPIKETVSTDFHHLLVEPDDVRRASEMIE